MHILIVDDEPLARNRLRTLLDDWTQQTGIRHKVREAANATEALAHLEAPLLHPSDTPVDVMLLDIHMPGLGGLELAQRVQQLPVAPAIVFVTAHDEHALNAFELDAVDYLTKPVRLHRLQQALVKAGRTKIATPAFSPSLIAIASAADHSQSKDILMVETRDRMEKVYVRQVLYFRAELKCITVCTVARDYVIDGSLNELEQRFGESFVRIHRNTLVARDAVRAVERHYDPKEGNEFWAVRLRGKGELLNISRRQLPYVRALLEKNMH